MALASPGEVPRLVLEAFQQTIQGPARLHAPAHLVRAAQQIEGGHVVHELVGVLAPGEAPPLPQLVQGLEDGHPRAQGQEGAPVHVVEWGDYQ